MLKPKVSETKEYNIECKIFNSSVKYFDDNEMTIEHFISTERYDRSGDKVFADGLQMDGVPVVLKEHGMSVDMGHEPIAKPLWFKVDKNEKGDFGILVKTKYFDGSKLNPPDNTGQRLYQKAKQGYMPYWSIGFRALERRPNDQGGFDITKWLLLEYSQVGVPDNIDAKSIETLAAKEVIKMSKNMFTFKIKSEQDNNSNNSNDGNGSNGNDDGNVNNDNEILNNDINNNNIDNNNLNNIEGQNNDQHNTDNTNTNNNNSECNIDNSGTQNNEMAATSTLESNNDGAIGINASDTMSIEELKSLAEKFGLDLVKQKGFFDEFTIEGMENVINIKGIKEDSKFSISYNAIDIIHQIFVNRLWDIQTKDINKLLNEYKEALYEHVLSLVEYLTAENTKDTKDIIKKNVTNFLKERNDFCKKNITENKKTFKIKYDGQKESEVNNTKKKNNNIEVLNNLDTIIKNHVNKNQNKLINMITGKLED